MSRAPTEPITLPRGANATRARDHNRQLVLGHIHAGGALGRAEVARRSGLTTQAVSNIIADLEADGLLHPVGAVRGRRGLPAMRYAVNPGGAYAFGAELRPATMLATLVDLGGRPVWEDRRPLSDAAPDRVAERLRAMRDDALAAVPGAAGRLSGAGVAMPGPFGRTALAGRSTDLPGWDGVDPASLLRDAMDAPVIVENDANAAAVAERIALAPGGIATFACLYFGTGLGLGIVQDGRLVAGAYGNAGEVGQLPVPGPNGPAALETLLSRASVERYLARSDRAAADMEALEALHAAGDPALAAWTARAADALGHALALIENMLDPQVTVLCGAMPASILLDIAGATRPPDTVARRPDAGPALRIGTASRMCAARGGAALVLSRVLTPAFAA